MNNTLQTVWEVLNAAVYDLTEGDPADALGAVEECRDLIEQLKNTAMDYTIQWIDEPAQTVRVPIISGLPVDDPQTREDALIRAFNAWGALGSFDASIDEHWTVLSIMGSAS